MPNRLGDFNGNVSGSGTLLYTIPYLREIIKGDWSEYTGTLIAYGSNASDGSILMIDNGGNGDGIPNGRVVATGNTKVCTYSNNLSISFGGLSTDQTGVKLSCGGTKNVGFGNGFTTYSIGGANTDETFKGIINNELYGSATANDGTTTIIKEGDGLWRLTGTNTYSGTTTVIGGKLVVNGSHTGAGAFTVTQGVLAGKGSITANVDVADTLQPGDGSLDKLTLKAKLTLESTSVTQIDINKSTTNTSDNVAVAGAIVYGGTLQINIAGTPVSGDVFKIFTVGSTFSGMFAQIIPATPGTGLVWKFKPATGELLVVTANFVEAPTNLTFTATSDAVSVTSTINVFWQDNSNNEISFILERSTDSLNFTDINHPVANAVSYVDNAGLVPNTKYYYRIKAQGPIEFSVYSVIVSIKTPALFEAPIAASVPTPANATVDVALNSGNLNLLWSGGSNTVTYTIYFGTLAGSLTKLSDVPYSTTPSYQITGLSDYTTYYWRIDATNAVGTTTGTQWSFRTTAAAAVAGDYRSKQTGGWNTLATWQTYDGTNWLDATALPSGVTPPATPTVNTITIKAGHTITLNATTIVNSVIVEPNAILKSDGTVRNLRISKSVINYGAFGTSTAAERINFEGYLDNGTITLGGTSTYYVNTFGVNTMAVNVNIILDANVSVNGYFHGYYSGTTTTGQDDDNVAITINEGKTVTMTSTGTLHETSSGSTNTTNAISTFGNYTYNINGVLDMKLATSTSSVVAHTTKGNSTTTFNVNGTWYTGSAMRLVSNLAAGTLPSGNIAFNIGANGAIDAGARGTNTNLVLSNSNNGQQLFFNITGNGALKYKVGSTAIVYPIGAGKTFSPVTLTNTGTADIIAVGIKNSLDNIVNDPTSVVNKQFTITPTTIGAANLAISLGWLTSDQAPNFNPANGVVVAHYSAAAAKWDETIATVSGAGTLTNPYYARASGFTSFSPFAVGNTNSTVLPLQLLSFQAAYNGKQTNLLWASEQEINVRSFLVERSLDGNDFLAIGNVAAKNTAGTNNYIYADLFPPKGISYYRLKIIDIDGSFKFSKIIGVDTKQPQVLSIFPNPASNKVTIVHTAVSNTSTISIFGIDGKLVKSVMLMFGATQTEINIADLAKGNYVVKINDGVMATLLFTKQ